MKTVSIIVPCFNEEKTIHYLLEAISKQTYPKELMEIIIADGMSTDQTRQKISGFSQKNPGFVIKVVDNLQRNIPSALNRAIESATGEIIVRLDAHSMPEDHYVERCVRGLEERLGDNVGGVWQIEASQNTLFARAIAAAASHPLGVGDAQYRYTTRAGEVDTVPFGSYYRSTFDRLGLFDESLLTNEDYEYNTRLRQHGGKIWLDPDIKSVYFSRPDLISLARQYWRYGYWKWQMLRRYPGTIRWRQALPPLFVFSIIGLAILGWFWKLAWIVLLIELLAYFVILATGSIPIAVKRKEPGIWPGIPLAIACMHIFWGVGFLWSALSTLRRKY